MLLVTIKWVQIISSCNEFVFSLMTFVTQTFHILTDSFSQEGLEMDDEFLFKFVSFRLFR